MNFTETNIPEQSRSKYSTTSIGSFSTSTTTVITSIVQDKHFKFEQGLPSMIWEIIHNLEKYPSVTVIDSANTIVEGEVTYIDLNTLNVNFSAGFSGTAYLN